MTEMKIHTAVDIHASAADAWTLFGEGFGDWADWSDAPPARGKDGHGAGGVRPGVPQAARGRRGGLNLASWAA